MTSNTLVKAWLTDNSRTAITFPFQHGKLIACTVPVWTEQGWKNHGDLQVGDYVYSPSGAPVKVEALSPEGIADYEVEFSDGGVVQCHGRHEWYVFNRLRQRWCVVQTDYMKREGTRAKNEERYNFSVPRILPLIMSSTTDLLIHPYALGAWLGDGRSDCFNISHGGDDWEVVRGIEDCGYKCTNRWVQDSTGVYYSYFAGLVTYLRRLGVLDDKHIPEQYLMGSIEQRLELLAGLIDTDGNYSADERGNSGGQYRFTNTNKRLVDQTAFLARTLGFKVGVIQEYESVLSSSGIQGKQTTYVVVFSPTRPIPCRIPRKQTTRLSEECRIAVVDVRRCDPKPGRCIQVEGGLYLVGKNLIPTHNSLLGSIYFPSWVILNWPETRIGLASYEESFAANFGGKVRDVVSKFGPAIGVRLRTDTHAKGEWIIDGHGGGMVCKGRGGAFLGRPVDLLILDDLIKNSEEAQSPTILDGIWDWYCTVAYSRLGPRAPVVGIGTRWCPKDLFGRWEAEAKAGGEKFTTVKFTAIAEKDDILGRQPGEALWPERVPLARLQKIAKIRPRWFKACWQGKPQEEEGLHFQPSTWPKYTDVGDAWRVRVGTQWNNYRKVECTIVIAVDWAQAGKKQSDKTAIVVTAVTGDGLVLVLEVLNKTLRYEENAPELEKLCQLYSSFNGEPLMQIVASDDDMLSDAMAVECRRYRSIPEIKRLAIKSRAKIIRAQAAIIRSQNGLFLLPDPTQHWFEEMSDQLGSFTGEEGAEDDIADCFGIIGRVADEFAAGDVHDKYDSVLGSAGYIGDGWL